METTHSTSYSFPANKLKYEGRARCPISQMCEEPWNKNFVLSLGTSLFKDDVLMLTGIKMVAVSEDTQA